MQAFVGLAFNSVLAGLVSPLVSHGGALVLAGASAVLCAAAWIVWRIYRVDVKCEPTAQAGAVPLEPTQL